MNNLKLPDTIYFYRRKQGLTQKELAIKLGVTNQSVSKWESAQCCPDISLIPKLAEILEISIDELFGREPKPTINNYNLCTGFPWPDDETLRIVFARGRKLLMENTDINEYINIIFPQDSNETTEPYFKLEVFGNLSCDTSINGNVNANGNVSCGDTIGGKVHCGGSITCGDSIKGDVKCCGNIECKTIEGNVECQGNILYN